MGMCPAGRTVLRSCQGASCESEAALRAAGSSALSCAERIHHDETAQPRCKRCVALDLVNLQYEWAQAVTLRRRHPGIGAGWARLGVGVPEGGLWDTRAG